MFNVRLFMIYYLYRALIRIEEAAQGNSSGARRSRGGAVRSACLEPGARVLTYLRHLKLGPIAQLIRVFYSVEIVINAVDQLIAL